MTLLDIDKSSDDRGSPTPNVHDVLNLGAVMARGTNSVNYTAAQIQNALGAAKNGQFTIVGSGTIASRAWVPTSANVMTITIPHGLSFVPAIVGWVLGFNQSSYAPIPHTDWDTGDLGFYPAIYMSTYSDLKVDATNIYFIYIQSGQPGLIGFTPTVRYYLLQQAAN